MSKESKHVKTIKTKNKETFAAICVHHPKKTGPGFHDDSNAQVDDEHVGEDHVHLRATPGSPGPSSNADTNRPPAVWSKLKHRTNQHQSITKKCVATYT